MKKKQVVFCHTRGGGQRRFEICHKIRQSILGSNSTTENLWPERSLMSECFKNGLDQGKRDLRETYEDSLMKRDL